MELKLDEPLEQAPPAECVPPGPTTDAAGRWPGGCARRSRPTDAGAGRAERQQGAAPASHRDHAYFVACEAITNAVKHASPSHIRVSAAQQDGGLRLVVADDGIGGAR